MASPFFEYLQKGIDAYGPVFTWITTGPLSPYGIAKSFYDTNFTQEGFNQQVADRERIQKKLANKEPLDLPETLAYWGDSLGGIPEMPAVGHTAADVVQNVARTDAATVLPMAAAGAIKTVKFPIGEVNIVSGLDRVPFIKNLLSNSPYRDFFVDIAKTGDSRNAFGDIIHSTTPDMDALLQAMDDAGGAVQSTAYAVKNMLNNTAGAYHDNTGNLLINGAKSPSKEDILDTLQHELAHMGGRGVALENLAPNRMSVIGSQLNSMPKYANELPVSAFKSWAERVYPAMTKWVRQTSDKPSHAEEYFAQMMGGLNNPTNAINAGVPFYKRPFSSDIEKDFVTTLIESMIDPTYKFDPSIRRYWQTKMLANQP